MYIKFDTFLISNINNFISNHRSLIKSTPFMQLFIGNLIQLVDFEILNSKGDTYCNINRCILLVFSCQVTNMYVV